MLENINIEEIRQYNNNLKSYKDKAVSLKAEIEYNTKELESLCKELSTELGVEVNSSNIESIYNDQLEKIKSELNTGNAILAKIASEQSGQVEQTPIQAQPVQQLQQAQPMQMQQTPLMSTQRAGDKGVVEQVISQVQQPVQQVNPFNNNVGAVGGTQTLPPLFSI